MTAEHLTAGAMLVGLVLTSWASAPLDTVFAVVTLVAAAAFLLVWMREPDEPEEPKVISLLEARDDVSRS